jgi:hypothetical protein
MQTGQHLQILTAQPFFAAIVGMAVQGKLSIRQPATQRFGIDAQATTNVGYRDNGHRATPFVWDMQQEREPPGNLLGKLPGMLPSKGLGSFLGAFPGRLPGLFRGRPGDSTHRFS